MGMLYDAQMRHVHTAGKRWDGSGYTCTECRPFQCCKCGHPSGMHVVVYDIGGLCLDCDPTNMVLRSPPGMMTEAYVQAILKACHQFERVMAAA